MLIVLSISKPITTCEMERLRVASRQRLIKCFAYSACLSLFSCYLLFNLMNFMFPESGANDQSFKIAKAISLNVMCAFLCGSLFLVVEAIFEKYFPLGIVASHGIIDTLGVHQSLKPISYAQSQRLNIPMLYSSSVRKYVLSVAEQERPLTEVELNMLVHHGEV